MRKEAQVKAEQFLRLGGGKPCCVRGTILVDALRESQEMLRLLQRPSSPVKSAAIKTIRDLLWRIPIIRSIAAEAIEEAASEYDYFHRGQGGRAGDAGHGAMCAVLYMRDKARAVRNRGLQAPPPPPSGQSFWIKS